MRTPAIITSILSLAFLLIGCSSDATGPSPTDAAFAKGGRAGSLGVVYVTSQGLYYDTFVTVEVLPPKGPFQLLENGQTEFGPGDPGYVGGRWWVDVNGNGVQDVDDSYLLCPLLGPGRATL